MFYQIITYFLSVSGLSAAAYFILKTLITKSFDFALEKYKSEVNKELESHKQKLQLDIEKFKAELNIASIEHNITFSNLQTQRADVIKTTYLKVVELSKHLQILTSMFQGPEWKTDRQKDKNAEIAFNDLNDYIVKNRIFLPKKICDNLFEITKECWAIMVEMSLTKDVASWESGPKAELHKRWLELEKTVNTDIAAAMTELEENFRKLLGDK